MSDRLIYRGTTEYISAQITGDTTLNTQTVEMSFDRTTWLTAEWVGTAGTTRTCRILASATNLPTDANFDVWVRITDTPEIPVLRAGHVQIV